MDLTSRTARVKEYLKNTSKKFKGAARRLFQAETVQTLGPGGQTWVERELGWCRSTIDQDNGPENQSRRTQYMHRLVGFADKCQLGGLQGPHPHMDSERSHRPPPHRWPPRRSTKMDHHRVDAHTDIQGHTVDGKGLSIRTPSDDILGPPARIGSGVQNSGIRGLCKTKVKQPRPYFAFTGSSRTGTRCCRSGSTG
jgi:hypothetical protein